MSPAVIAAIITGILNIINHLIAPKTGHDPTLPGLTLSTVTPALVWWTLRNA